MDTEMKERHLRMNPYDPVKDAGRNYGIMATKRSDGRHRIPIEWGVFGVNHAATGVDMIGEIIFRSTNFDEVRAERDLAEALS